mgnify:CR=1 FL=1
MDDLGNFIIKSVDFMFESGILIVIYVFFAVGYIFYKLRDKFFSSLSNCRQKIAILYLHLFTFRNAFSCNYREVFICCFSVPVDDVIFFINY